MAFRQLLAFLLGVAILACPAALANSAPEAAPSQRVPDEVWPMPIAGTEPAFSTAEVCLFDPETLERGRIRFDRKANGRPEDFWWPSPDAYLRGVFGNCPLRVCCKFCLKGKPCGDTCISRSFTCRKANPCGCACRRPLFSEVPSD